VSPSCGQTVAQSRAAAKGISGFTGGLIPMSKNDESRRKRLIKLIHVARRELGMQDEDYRAMLAAMPALGGKTSSADLGIKGLEIVMRALKARGFKVRSNGPKGPNTSRKLADDDQSRL